MNRVMVKQQHHVCHGSIDYQTCLQRVKNDPLWQKIVAVGNELLTTHKKRSSQIISGMLKDLNDIVDKAAVVLIQAFNVPADNIRKRVDYLPGTGTISVSVVVKQQSGLELAWNPFLHPQGWTVGIQKNLVQMLTEYATQIKNTEAAVDKLILPVRAELMPIVDKLIGLFSEVFHVDTHVIKYDLYLYRSNINCTISVPWVPANTLTTDMKHSILQYYFWGLRTAKKPTSLVFDSNMLLFAAFRGYISPFELLVLSQMKPGQNQSTAVIEMAKKLVQYSTVIYRTNGRSEAAEHIFIKGACDAP